ncbi:AraC family transcriptional regulator [Kineococcus sp. SYSU DK001]|uniref:AraC family transcriptional regulator n=1 Tax=Kineococcus sp. SYSU DK001 TaxID=3383122 RepID=UPI003D7E054F
MTSVDPGPGDEDDGFGSWGHAPHSHRFDQFLTATAGTAVVVVDGVEHPLNVAAGLWVPAGVVHSARFEPGFAPFVHDVEAGVLAAGSAAAAPVRVSAALRNRLLRVAFDGGCLTTVLAGVLGAPGGADAGPRGEDALAEVLRLARRRFEDPVASEVAARLRENPDDDRSLEEWAAALHTSSATIRRAFHRDTGGSFSTWRTALRVATSVTLLGRGVPVGQVARSVGLSHNGLIAAHRRWLGRSPSDVRAGAPRTGAPPAP